MRVSDDELSVALSRVLGPLGAVERSPSPWASTATLENLEVTARDGSAHQLVLKAGGRATAREAQTYQGLLCAEPLGTPRWVTGSDRGGGWLVIETIAGAPLWQSDGTDAWCAAARRLAHVHRQLAGRTDDVGPAAGTDYETQLALAAARDPRVWQLRGAHAEAASVVRAAPLTVIHGEAFASNVLVTSGGDVVLVDWETAGRGCGLTDLAALTAGWAAPDQDRIASAYSGDLTALPAARLLLAVRWLGEPAPSPGAGGGRSRHTDWWSEAAGALP